MRRLPASAPSVAPIMLIIWLDALAFNFPQPDWARVAEKVFPGRQSGGDRRYTKGKFFAALESA